jgi:DNA gyrase subunit A
VPARLRQADGAREFRLQSRGGKGVILIDASERNGPVVGVGIVKDEHEVMLVTDQGQMLRIKASEIRETGRNAQGVKLMDVADEERIVAIEVLEPQPESLETASNPPPSSPEGAVDAEGRAARSRVAECPATTSSGADPPAAPSFALAENRARASKPAEQSDPRAGFRARA